MICKYCGVEYDTHRAYRIGLCPSCDRKVSSVRKFGKARDDLRERLGLKRMGKERL